MGALVKDAFVVPVPTERLIALMEDKASPETSFGDISPADAKVRITDAIGIAAMTLPALGDRPVAGGPAVWSSGSPA